MQLEIVTSEEGCHLEIYQNQQGEVISIPSIFEYASGDSDSLDVRRFILGTRLDNTHFMVCDRCTLRSTAACVWSLLSIRWSWPNAN